MNPVQHGHAIFCELTEQRMSQVLSQNAPILYFA